ncbi:putative zinc-binding metallopeptidase [Gordonia sp. ABSL1-1]|uniref:zinc-binding metallopeptidase family protein n=1 Tax=Gordonia sp. ABSL1-1 TaxID=3053923 RepID=UPI00257361C2|nr:putative zinc-binding metallopeptidase [Gordonia sp. ABSL1-1]MDL9936899.1 putative zinc-binding metallopeptidase [Gordonia sp. ABSL1-1]
MHALTCPICNGLSGYANRECPFCGTPVGVHLPSRSLVVASEDGIEIEGRRWVRCSNRHSTGCNWMTPAELDDDILGLGSRCFAGSLVRGRPDADDTIALEKLRPASLDLRLLVYQLVDLGLPVEPYWRTDGGLAFDLLSSQTLGHPVTIGHANGVITIDLAETQDAYRERLRVNLGEPYRTMLGHFRHEVGHYYQHILVETGDGADRYLDTCRELFGDERAGYADAIERHYKFGAQADWRKSYISEYATMHPWEDFAECFAHYLHITGTIDTARESGLMLRADQVRFSMDRDLVPLESYADQPIERLLYDWKWLSTMFNRVNAAMGRRPLYPFDIPRPVVRKLGFVHKVIRESASRNTTGGLLIGPAPGR